MCICYETDAVKKKKPFQESVRIRRDDYIIYYLVGTKRLKRIKHGATILQNRLSFIIFTFVRGNFVSG